MVLGLTAARVQSYKEAGRAPYARILGFRKESRELLALVKQKTAIPLITKTADAPRILTGTALDMFSQDIYASHIRQVDVYKRQTLFSPYAPPYVFISYGFIITSGQSGLCVQSRRKTGNIHTPPSKNSLIRKHFLVA